LPSSKTLNAKNLEALGAKRLAELLLEVTSGNAAQKRQLRLALAGSQGPGELARAIRKRLTELGRSQAFVDWKGRKALIRDLESQRAAILDLAKSDAPEAMDLMWRFVELAPSVHERCDDGSGTIGQIFGEACEDLGRLAEAARPDPVRLADLVVAALSDNGYGQYDGLITEMAPALGDTGLDNLKAHFTNVANKQKGPKRGSRFARVDHNTMTAQIALQEIADLQGDVEAFCNQFEPHQRRFPRIAAQIALRLLHHDRAQEALEILDNAERQERRTRDIGWIDFEWDDARIAALEALGRPEEAQVMRWTCFTDGLSPDHLSAYLKRLPDFEDFEAEAKALDLAKSHASQLHGLAFLINWPALDRAADLVVTRADELNGNHYEVLTPAAEALSAKHPLAAILCLRAMIDFALEKARSSRYGHAARHLTECKGLAQSIEDFGPFEVHETYESRLRDTHGRKSGFWSRVR
jgi:Family of unknown function (DUF6880)